MKKLYKLAATAAMALVFTAHANAAVSIITFDEPGIGATVDGFYNGGGGPNFGADFRPGDWVVLGGFGQTSQPNFAFSQSGSGYLNIASGFTGALSFTYGAFNTFSATVFDGLNGTGTALGSVILGPNNVNAFDLVTINFGGTGRSFAISGGGAQFGFDDVTFSNGVPEPAAWTLMIAGFGLVGAAARRRQSVRVAYA